MADKVKVKNLITEAAALCVAAGHIADRYAQFVEQQTEVKSLLTPLPDKTDPIVGTRVEEINTQLTKAEEEAKKHDFPKAVGLLDDARTKCAAAVELKATHEKYTLKLDPLKLKVDPLLPADPDIGADVPGIKTKLANAQIEAGKPDYPAAMKLLAQTQLAYDSAQLKKKMKGNAKPTATELKDLLDQPDGEQALDDLIENLDPDTVNQEVFTAALEARFKVKFSQYKQHYEDDTSNLDPSNVAQSNQPEKSVKQFYALLKKVPGKHGKNNEKFLEIIHYKVNEGGADYGKGKVTMYCGRAGAGASSDYNKDLNPGDTPEARRLKQGKFWEFFPDGVDLECEQANSDLMPYFDWATLHEVGHAVDDRLGFMRGNGSGDTYGGWEDYGGNVIPVATAAVNHFLNTSDGDVIAYIAKVLTGESLPTFSPLLAYPLKRGALEAWCEAVRETKSLWWDGGSSKANAIGDRVYQESYAGKWVSYLLAKRKQGIHGYQFRAPGEWFAEIYAAYYCGKLKPGHPAVQNGNGWLAKLPEPE